MVVINNHKDKVKQMPSDVESIQQEVSFWKKYIHKEREIERLTANSSVLLPRLLDGLYRSENRLRKLAGKRDA
jgi:hypothetical protein